MDYDIIPGRSSENAVKALELAESRGFEPADVRTFRDGYYVPVNLDEAEKPAPKSARKRTAKKE